MAHLVGALLDAAVAYHKSCLIYYHMMYVLYFFSSISSLKISENLTKKQLGAPPGLHTAGECGKFATETATTIGPSQPLTTTYAKP